MTCKGKGINTSLKINKTAARMGQMVVVLVVVVAPLPLLLLLLLAGGEKGVAAGYVEEK